MNASPPLIDGHHHFWRLDRGDYSWLTKDLGVLYRDFGPVDLEPLLEMAGIQRTVLVQAADTVEESEYLLELASRTEFVAGVVGWVPMGEPRFDEALARLAGHRKFVGVRPMVQDIKDDEWLLGRSLVSAFEELKARRLAFDALVLPRHLRHLITVLERHPELRVVIDHGAKPRIAEGGRSWSGFSAWKEALETIADAPRTMCKLSGLVTEAAGGWTTEDLVPFADAIFEAFGDDRVMWGSDWPVVNLAGGYDSWWTATGELLARLGPGGRANVLGGNAARFYGVEESI